jgi:hypothetical protein
MFPAPPEYLRLAKQHVVDAERAISLQRWRIERLRALGADVSDAEALLGTFLQTLVAMQQAPGRREWPLGVCQGSQRTWHRK